jgi:branched-chain amino acid transport system permease protein
METFVQSMVSGILTGSLYAMIGIGLTVIFGVMRIINMAHGDLVMLGMYGAFWAHAAWRIDPFLSILIWVPGAFILGGFIYRFLLRKIVAGGELNTLLYTAGLSLFIANLALLIWTGDYRTIKLPYAIMPLRPLGIAVPIPLAIAFGMAILVTAALYWFLVHTDTGRAIRATSQEPEAAALMGVDVKRITIITFALGTALASGAGVLLAPALPLLLPWARFCGQVLRHRGSGGLGSITGAIAGGLLLGWSNPRGSRLRLGAVQGRHRFVIFLLVLLFGPRDCSESVNHETSSRCCTDSSVRGGAWLVPVPFFLHLIMVLMGRFSERPGTFSAGLPARCPSGMPPSSEPGLTRP